MAVLRMQSVFSCKACFAPVKIVFTQAGPVFMHTGPVFMHTGPAFMHAGHVFAPAGTKFEGFLYTCIKEYMDIGRFVVNNKFGVLFAFKAEKCGCMTVRLCAGGDRRHVSRYRRNIF